MESHLYYTEMKSPIGDLVLLSSREGLARILLPNEGGLSGLSRLRMDESVRLTEDIQKNREPWTWLESFFEGNPSPYPRKLDLSGTQFQIEVWNAVARIPFGRTKTYAEIASQIGNPKACRAVGTANGSNPVPIVIPCHRVIGSDGSLTGYAGGIGIKKQLLALEGSFFKDSQSLFWEP